MYVSLRKFVFQKFMSLKISAFSGIYLAAINIRESQSLLTQFETQLLVSGRNLTKRLLFQQKLLMLLATEDIYSSLKKCLTTTVFLTSALPTTVFVTANHVTCSRSTDITSSFRVFTTHFPYISPESNTGFRSVPCTFAITFKHW